MLLQKRANGYYYFRWVVPLSHRIFFKKTEFIRSLGTKSLLQAQVLATNLSYEILRIKVLVSKMDDFEADEYKSLCEIAWGNLCKINKSIEDLPHGYLVEQLEEAGNYLDVLRDNHSALNKKFTLPLSACKNELASAGLTISDVPESFHEQFANDLIKMCYRISYDKVERLKFLLKNEISIDDLGVDGVGLMPHKITFEEVFSQFLSYKVSHGLSEGDQKDYASKAPIISGLIGSVSFDEIKRKNLIVLLDDLSFLPKRNKAPYNRMTTKQVLDVVRSKNISVDDIISPKTVLEFKKLLQGIFKYAVDVDIINESPAKDLVVASVGKGNKRSGFIRSELRDLLSAALELDVSSPRLNSLKWIVLIAAYSGARLGEIVGLRGIDIKCDSESGLWYFNHSSSSGATKSKNAQRLVPVHSHLIALGILESLSIGCDVSLFADIPDAKVVTRWFPRFRGRSGIGSKSIDGCDLSFHSFRHSFITITRENGALAHIVQQVVGHEQTSYGITDTYTGGASLTTKNLAVECFRIT